MNATRVLVINDLFAFSQIGVEKLKVVLRPNELFPRRFRRRGLGSWGSAGFRKFSLIFSPSAFAAFVAFSEIVLKSPLSVVAIASFLLKRCG